MSQDLNGLYFFRFLYLRSFSVFKHNVENGVPKSVNAINTSLAKTLDFGSIGNKNITEKNVSKEKRKLFYGMLEEKLT